MKTTRARWLLIVLASFALLVLGACDTDDGGTDGAEGTGTPAATATEAGAEQTATPEGTPSGDATAPEAAGDGGAYSAALELALEEEIGSEDVGTLLDEWDIDVLPTGEGLPPGSGTPEEGGQIYQAQCAACHGQELQGGIGPQLVADEPGTAWQPGDAQTVGNWWPYATTVWDYIHRAMPFFEPGTLTPDEVYALTAYILAENELIDPGQELNQDNLADVEMPARDAYRACWPDLCYEEYGHDDDQ